jgi:2Fe-2S ferredoxin
MARVTFLPIGVSAEAAPGESLFDVARRLDVPVPTACVGKATCGLCRVQIVDGEAHLSPRNAAEVKHLGNTYFITKLRLSCQAALLPAAGAVTVRLPDMPPLKKTPA